MEDLDLQERAFLAQARRGLSPAPSHQARVLGRVSTALAAGMDGALEPAAPSSWLVKAAAGVGASALIAGAGYWAGHRVGLTEGSRPAPVVQSVPPTPSSTPSASVAPTPPPVAPARETPAPAEKLGRPSMPPPKPSATPDELDEELRVLRRAERALRSHNPQFAVGLLEDLERALPAGRLLEERRAALAIGRCQSTFGPPRADLFAAFERDYPGSVYLARVTSACREEGEKSTEPAPPGDSSSNPESER